MPNDGIKHAPAERGRKENLSKDNISTIVEAILNAMESCGHTNLGSECPATHSSGCPTTMDHTIPEMTLLMILELSLQAPPTQDIGEYNYVLSTLIEYCTGGTSLRDESFSYSLVNL